MLTLYWFAGCIEFTGGILVTLGLFTRPAAFIMSGEMAIAYFHSHAPRGFFPILNSGDGAILFCFIFFCGVCRLRPAEPRRAMAAQARLSRGAPDCAGRQSR